MKKQLSILAAATLTATFAQAQTAPLAVTFYGALDAGVLSTSTTGGAAYNDMATSAGSSTIFKDGGIGGSNLGVKGSRDIGQGRKAFFQLQGNIKLNDGSTGGPNTAATTSNLNQMAFIGLSGSAGEIKLGRQVAPMYYAFASTDVRQGRYFGSALTGLVGMNSASKVFVGNNSGAAFGTVYNDNSMTYSTPEFNNTTVTVQHAFGNVNGDNGASAQDSVTAQYNNKAGLKLSAVYYNGKGNNKAAINNPAVVLSTDTNRLTQLGALYAWDKFSVSGSIFKASNPSGITAAGGSTDLSMNSLGFGYKMAPDLNLTSGYYAIKDNTNSGNTAKQLAVGLDYALYQDTLMYIQTASTSNNGANMNLSPVYATTVAANKSNTAWMVGLRYTF